MPATRQKAAPRITPYLLYEDVGAALGWLAKAFGLREQSRMAGPDGAINHAAMEFADGETAIMLGCPGPTYKNPKRLGHVTQSLYVHVDDVDKHFDRAKKAGATILAEPEDQVYGDRRYGAADLEGHHWYFAQHIRPKRTSQRQRPA